MATWLDVDDYLPFEKELVTIRAKGKIRRDYYRIDGRWYSMRDLERWRMNTSPYWNEDRAWYLETEEIQGWQGPSDIWIPVNPPARRSNNSR